MKKIGICTYCTWTSNGSILQAFALKNFLYNELNAESVIVCDDHRTLENIQSKNHNLTFQQKLKQIIKNVISQKKYRDEIYKKNHQFIIENIDFVFYEGFEALERNPPEFDLYIAGSDQIFHPNLCKRSFFLDFVKAGKKVSYAASMGITRVKSENENSFSRLLNNFDYISVREQDNIPIISKYYQKGISTNIDPTFLMNCNQWRKIEKPYKVNGKYFLVYPLYWDVSLNKRLKRLEKKSGIQIYTICNGYTRAYGKKLYDVGVQEFLWLIDNAEGVITSSFHGVALSIIFRKNLVAVPNPASPSRINCLQKSLNLDLLNIEELATENVDYSDLDRIITEEREKTYQYLKRWIYEQ